MGPDGLITVRGRRTNLLRTTPIAIVEIAGRRWVMSPFGEVNWVRNLRGSGSATITLNRRRENIVADELSQDEVVEWLRDTLAPYLRTRRLAAWIVRNLDQIDIEHPVETAAGLRIFELHRASMIGSPNRRPPPWLKLANRLNVTLLRRGFGPKAQHLLSVPGRRSGVLRTNPVATVDVDGNRYIVAGWETSDWVRNVRAAGWGLVGRGRHPERFRLTEVPIAERPPILREFARYVRGGRAFLTVAANASSDDFATASPNHPIFRLDSPGGST
jgi:deazaflavin-dependent oxidoreductase (nitroreductase family)